MTDATSPETTPADLRDLPLQPTGSGVADTEMARMQAELASQDAVTPAGDLDEASGGVDEGTPTRTQA
jgi:hypothetical protein